MYTFYYRVEFRFRAHIRFFLFVSLFVFTFMGLATARIGDVGGHGKNNALHKCEVLLIVSAVHGSVVSWNAFMLLIFRRTLAHLYSLKTQHILHISKKSRTTYLRLRTK